MSEDIHHLPRTTALVGFWPGRALAKGTAWAGFVFNSPPAAQRAGGWNALKEYASGGVGVAVGRPPFGLMHPVRPVERFFFF